MFTSNVALEAELSFDQQPFEDRSNSVAGGSENSRDRKSMASTISFDATQRYTDPDFWNVAFDHHLTPGYFSNEF